MKAFNLLFVLAISISCASQDAREKENKIETIEEQTQLLEESFIKISNATDSNLETNELIFFESFPDSFEKFVALYGVDKPLYESGYDHLMALYNLKTISIKSLVEKYIELSKNGIWNADNTGDLQWQSFDKITNNTEVANRYLMSMSELEVRSVFYFLLDGPHPEDKGKKTEFEILVEKFRQINPIYVEWVQSEYSKVVKARTH